MNDNKAQAAYHPDQPPGENIMTTNIERAIEILEDEHDPFAGLIDAPSLVYALNDAGLIAAAPEAVAEVVRLRRELEELRDDLGKAEYSSGPDPDDHALGEIQEASRIGRHITRILNPKGES